jgi:hypothetical protein
MPMRSDRIACWLVALVAVSLMTSSMADARSIHHRRVDHPYPRAAYDAIGDGPFQYRGNFAYGANRVPYRYDGAGTRDFQLEGR